MTAIHTGTKKYHQVRALDKREYLMIIERKFFLFLTETICYDPSPEPSGPDSSDEGKNNIYFYAELTKIIPNYHQILPLI